MPEATTALITGATDGLGRHVAIRLGRAGTRMLLHGRDPGRAAEVREAIVAGGGPEPEILLADLADLGAVARLADYLGQREARALPQAYDPVARRQLREACDGLLAAHLDV